MFVSHNMRKLLILGLLLLPGMIGYSQLTLGIKGGLNFSKFKADDLETADYKLSTFDGRKTGFHIGIFTRVDLFGLFVQPEMIYTVLRGETAIFDVTNQTEMDPAQIQIGRLDIPALVGGKLGPVRLGAGPVASFNMTNRTELQDLIGYIPEIRAAMVGYQLGAGIDILSFTIDLRYEGNLTKLGDSMEIGGENVSFDRRTNQVIFSLGLSF
jgi:hypothetical protein